MKKLLLSIVFISIFSFFLPLLLQGQTSDILKPLIISDSQKKSLSDNTIAIPGEKVLLDYKNNLFKTAKNKQQLTIEIPISANKNEILELTKIEMFAADGIINVASKSMTKISGDDMPLFYFGKIKGNKKSDVILSIHKDKLHGRINIGNKQLTLDRVSDSDLHMVYQEKDLPPDSFFECGVETSLQIPQVEHIRHSKSASNASNAINIYVEVEHDLYLELGGYDETVTHVLDLFVEVKYLYMKEEIDIVISELKIWDYPDPYDNKLSDIAYLTQFADGIDLNFNGDIAHLLGFATTRYDGKNIPDGFAKQDVLCSSKNRRIAFTRIKTNYEKIPIYSKSVHFITHEIGHNLGSEHTHDPVWGPNHNEAIDHCGYESGGTIFPEAGTIMSYCHRFPSIGVDFNLGFGPEPGDLIRSKVNEAFSERCLPINNTCDLIATTNFEESNGGWVDGGTDCTIGRFTNFADSGENCIQLRDNTSTSTATSPIFDLNYTNGVKLLFSYITNSMDNANEDFFLEKSVDGGVTYEIIEEWNYGDEFQNLVRKNEEVFVSGPFSPYTTFRFRCHASGDKDWVYIDDISIFTCGKTTKPWVSCELLYTDFEANNGGWIDGGHDCYIGTFSNYAASGQKCIRLRDNSATSIVTSPLVDLRHTNEIWFSFSYITKSMDNATEDFFLEMSIDGGLTFQIVEEWNLGDEFLNNVRENEEIMINGPFSPLTKFRFRCDASGYADWVYIDDISIVAECPSAVSRQRDIHTTELRDNTVAKESFRVNSYPNPVSSGVELIIELEDLSDVQQVLLYNQSGILVSSLDRSRISHKTTIDTENLKSGVYFLNVLANENTFVKRIVVL